MLNDRYAGRDEKRYGALRFNGRATCAHDEPTMKIPARQLAVGDILRVNDWRLHVVAVEREIGTAVLTAEFDFLLHFTRDDMIHVVTSSGARSVAA